MSDANPKCSYCDSELTSGRCEYCGTWVDTNFLGNAKKSVGIHPALAKRYSNSKEPVQGSSKEANKSVVSVFSETTPPSVPGYELQELIGKGAMGFVFRAKHIASGREAAVKILSSEMSSRADLVARFEREALALSSFRHPNVVAIFDSGSVSNIHYFCMEYVKGTTLRQFLREETLPLEQALKWISQILRGLKAAHDRGIIHRDLKPENVLVDYQRDRIVLVDFGLAGLLNEEANPHPNLTRSRVTMGTVNYMAPEQHMDAKRVDARSDLYSVGVILYECILGDLPLGRFALPSERNFVAPPSLDHVFAKALSREPSNRYQTAAEFEQALEQVTKDLASYIVPVRQEIQKSSYWNFSHKTENPTQWGAVPPWVQRTGFIWGTLALIVGLIIGVVLSRRQPYEVVVSSRGVNAITSGVEFVAFGKNWKSDSPVWEFVRKRISYEARQGDAGHFRQDFSLLTEQDKLIDFKWSSRVNLESLKLPMGVSKTQLFAREGLGSELKAPAGGILFVSPDVSRALGMVAYPDGTCSAIELKKQDGLFQVVQQIQSPCKHKNPLLTVNLDMHLGQLDTWVQGKPFASLTVKKVAYEKWQRAFACRNITCNFEPEL